MDLCYPLLGRTINLDGTSYFVHGLVHNTPLIPISRKFKEKIRSKFKGYDVICEDGFFDWMENAISFNEAEHFGLNKLSFSHCLSFFRILFYNKFTQKHPKTKFIKELREMKTIEDFYSIREELFREYLPEPEGMNQLLTMHNSGTLDNICGELPLRVKRYLYEAKQSIDYASSNSLKELHIIVGCAHELPLEYLLKNTELLNRISV